MTIHQPALRAAIDEAAVVLRRGGLVAFPTETVYGLGADACDDAAVAGIFAAKARPAFNPLIVHVVSRSDAQIYGRFSAAARRLADVFWPGPLTLVVPAVPDCRIGRLARAGLDSVALRVPAHPIARAIIAAAGIPIAAPSANRSGRVSPTTADHVHADLGGRVDLIVDGGPCAVGLESTIVSCFETPALLRPGGVPVEAIEAALGEPLADAAADRGRPLAPGRLASHYAPRAGLRLNAQNAAADEAVLDFAGRLRDWRHRAAYRDLSPRGDLAAAAARLFGLLHDLDAAGVATIAVAPVPFHGLGLALNDRLERAAAPRPASEVDATG